MRLYSYVVARDFGFAPNPFFGYCTLATCKPQIRRLAEPGNWVIGTGTAARNRAGYLVFSMIVKETPTFEEYWADERFEAKKPNLRGSKKQAFGDNIYSRPTEGRPWEQLDSHHSFPDGRPNPSNIQNDTQTNRVLVAQEFVYWGGSGPQIPEKFRNWGGCDICAKRAHRSNFPEEMLDKFLEWVRSLGGNGFMAEPLDWRRTP
jgi:hypothetical protein